MKTFLRVSILVFIALVVVLGVLHWVLTPSASTTGTATSTNQGVTVAPPTSQGVQQSFTAQIQNANQITLDSAAIIVMPYALQPWSDENKGGEALLKYSDSSGWQLVSLGGGEWDVFSLEQQGVPESIAAQLAAKQN